MTEQEMLQWENMEKHLMQLEERLVQCEQVNSVLLRANQQILDYAKGLERDMNLWSRNIKYEMLDERNLWEIYFPKIRSAEEAVEEIVKGKKSLVRFGDGEFAAMMGQTRAKFHTQTDEGMALRLKEVLQNQREDVVTAIADNYGNLDAYTVSSQREIRAYMSPEVREFHSKVLLPGKIYYNAYLSRPYAMYADKGTSGPAERFQSLRKLWEGKKCVFIEGEKTRMGVGNDLFSNAGSIQRILAPAVNAFRVYDWLLAEAEKCSKEVVFLLALGPTATVLAYDLAVRGYQALDIGHLDLEYEWYLLGAEGRARVPHKYNNEYPDGELVEDIEDALYEQQIIARCV